MSMASRTAARILTGRSYASNHHAIAWFTPIGVIGGGLMGRGIAQTAAMNGFNVTLVDIKQEYLDTAVDEMKKTAEMMINFQVKKGKMKPNVAKKLLMTETFARIKTTTDLNALNEVDLCVESVVENMEIKEKLYKQLEGALNKDCVLGSNTSSYSITELGRMSGRSDKFVGMHFFNPVVVMQLVELIKTPDTSDSTFAAAQQFCKMITKTSVECKDTPGFIVNRLLVPYLSQACLMMDREVATYSDIDKAMKLGAGMPQGPMQLADFVGLDTCEAILTGWMEKYPEEKIFAMPKALTDKVAAGQLGRKTGQGFYKWDGDRIVA
eukprot:NODE_956_length_1207_cov_68.291019_g721_i0.p1 GENE.NODE_956_length_1207_cov_68.291019_g721_i0~~NODE_956_length_1207_cov_68.291019_g721_i0.p1  ORF type:complete len:324 (-),score=102.11 NODE_956_length_1207_cov_68.291019_g721_i0:179-1150(-)